MLFCSKVIKTLDKKLLDSVCELNLVNVKIILNIGYKIKSNKMIIKSLDI